MLQKGVGWTTSSSILGTRRLAVRSRAGQSPITPPIIPRAEIAPIVPVGPTPAPGTRAQLRHQLPQASSSSPSFDRADLLSASAMSETASRMAASRSPTPARSAAKGSALVEYRAAALGTVEPSNSATPAAPAGAIPERILRYLSRSDIPITFTRPEGFYSKGRSGWSNRRALLDGSIQMFS